MQTFKFKIGKIYIGDRDPFEVITVEAPDVKTALNMAANYLKPNFLQTLTVIGQPK